MRASRCPTRRPFAHNSPDALAHAIEALLHPSAAGSAQLRSGVRTVFVAVESLYSMDGDVAPLTEYLAVIERLLPRGNGSLIVDEVRRRAPVRPDRQAHSTGLYGRDGRGCVCALGIANRCLVRLHTFGKSLACSGGARSLIRAITDASSGHPLQSAHQIMCVLRGLCRTVLHAAHGIVAK